MKREDAFALVRKHGGQPREGVTKQTNVLVVGELGWPLLDDGRPSNSLAQAKSYRIPIASERQFLQWLGRSAPEDGLLNPGAIAETYYQIHRQHRSAWTMETEVRPYSEKF